MRDWAQPLATDRYGMRWRGPGWGVLLVADDLR